MSQGDQWQVTERVDMTNALQFAYTLHAKTHLQIPYLLATLQNNLQKQSKNTYSVMC